MEYASNSIAEQEVVIRLDRETGQAHVSSAWPEWSRKLAKLYGPPQKTSKSSRDGRVTCACWTVPINRVSLRRGPRVSKMTPEQRQAVGERLRRLRQINSTGPALTCRRGLTTE